MRSKFRESFTGSEYDEKVEKEYENDKEIEQYTKERALILFFVTITISIIGWIESSFNYKDFVIHLSTIEDLILTSLPFAVYLALKKEYIILYKPLGKIFISLTMLTVCTISYIIFSYFPFEYTPTEYFTFDPQLIPFFIYNFFASLVLIFIVNIFLVMGIYGMVIGIIGIAWKNYKYKDMK